MNFKESYQKEMDALEKPSGIAEQVLNVVDAEQEVSENARKGRMVWRTAAAAIAVICVLGLTLQQEQVMSFARSIMNRFELSVNDEDMEFGKIEPIDVNIENFETAHDSAPAFDSYQEMHEFTNLVLPAADQVEYRELYVHLIREDLYGEFQSGVLAATILYQGESYNINGMFALPGFSPAEEGWGYGSDGKIVEEYQYGKGKKAYFVKDADGYQKVYFEEENILFQLFFDNGDDIESGAATASKKQTKELLDLFGRQ